MNIVDRQAIEDLFRRLRDAEKDGGPRDPEAEKLIERLVSRQPTVAYYLAQTVLVQQWALNAAHDRIEHLERRGAGGILSALFGGRSGSADRRASSGAPSSLGHTATTGFLATASNTALGVAGGFILADLLAQASFTDEAFASGVGSAEAASPVEAGTVDGGFGGDFGGGDFGGGGDAGGF